MAISPRAHRQFAEPADYAVLTIGALLVAAWTFRALHDLTTADLGVAYQAGQVSWNTGHPEVLFSWTGTPFLALVMALVSRVLSVATARVLITLLNTALVVGSLGVLLRQLQGRIPVLWWRLLVIALCCFAPVLSTVWFKQFNIIALVLAAGGFALVRRSRVSLGAALIGASVAFKPLVILLPFAMLLRRQTRRAGLLILVWAAGLSLLALAFLAWRAHDASVLDPLSAYRNFAHKMDPHRFGYACFIDNFAPSATLCRLGGTRHWTAFQLTSLALVALLATWATDALRGRLLTSWDAFAFVCALSVMVGPVSWSHYQIMLLPLFLVLLIRFGQGGASFGVWVGLAAAFVLVSLDWEPYGTSLEFGRTLLSSGRVSDTTGITPGLITTEAVAQFAQYVLIITGLLWYWRHGDPTRTPASVTEPRSEHSQAAEPSSSGVGSGTPGPDRAGGFPAPG